MSRMGRSWSGGEAQFSDLRASSFAFSLGHGRLSKQRVTVADRLRLLESGITTARIEAERSVRIPDRDDNDKTVGSVDNGPLRVDLHQA